MSDDESLQLLENSNVSQNRSDISVSSMNVLNDNMHGETNNIADDLQNNDDPQDTDPINQLVTAAQCGNIELLKYYLEKSKDNLNPISPNITDNDGITLIHWAALNNRLATIKYLVSKGAHPDVPAGDMNATPLLWAARYGLVYIADYLVREAHADCTVVDKNGIGILLASVFSSNVMMVIYSLWALDGLNDNVGLAGVNIADPTGRTALHWAAYQGDFLTVDVLLNSGAKVDLLDSEGFTPLHWALVNGSKSVVSSLLIANSNVKLQTGNGRSMWNIAEDMKHLSMWKSVLINSFRDPKTGDKLKSLISNDTATFTAFVIPYVTLPLAILILTSNSNILLQIFTTFILFIIQQLTLKRIVIPALKEQKINLLKTPFFAGIFSSTLYWCIVTWIFKMGFPAFKIAPISNIILLFASTTTTICFTKAMTMDPGYIPAEKNPLIVKDTIFELLKTREFDSNHFCIHTNIRKPLRSKFSRETKLNIARFDHYCPWVNNNIGVRNHKVFFAFVVALNLAIFLWIRITLKYFNNLTNITEPQSCQYLSNSLCKGYYNSPFILGLFWWVCFQAIWLTFLVLVQSFQISKGYTTYEFSHKHKHEKHDNTFSSVPLDDAINLREKNNDDDILEDGDEIPILTQSITNNIPLPNTCLVRTIQTLSRILSSKFCQMVGLDQMIFITTDIVDRKMKHTKRNNFNFGLKQNWIDFLFLKRTGDPNTLKSLISLPLHGEGNINGILVDYYKLYKLPQEV